MHTDPHDDHYGIERPLSEDEPGARDLAPPDEVSEYPGASRLAPAAPGNYRRWRGDAPRPISQIVIHITDGRERIAGPIGMFQRPGTQASAHYIVGQEGEVVQMVRHRDIAWHACAANATSVGIEHCARSPKELGRDDRGLPVTDAQYAASAALVRWLCAQLQIPMDRDHIQGHCEADPKTTHQDCPNRIWDWTRYLALVKGPQAD